MRVAVLNPHGEPAEGTFVFLRLQTQGSKPDPRFQMTHKRTTPEPARCIKLAGFFQQILRLGSAWLGQGVSAHSTEVISGQGTLCWKMEEYHFLPSLYPLKSWWQSPFLESCQPKLSTSSLYVSLWPKEYP